MSDFEKVLFGFSLGAILVFALWGLTILFMEWLEQKIDLRVKEYLGKVERRDGTR